MKNFAPGEPIDLTAVVELEVDGVTSTLFHRAQELGPGGKAPAEGNPGHHAAIATRPEFDGPEGGGKVDGQDRRGGGEISRGFSGVIAVPNRCSMTPLPNSHLLPPREARAGGVTAGERGIQTRELVAPLPYPLPTPPSWGEGTASLITLVAGQYAPVPDVQN